MSKIKTKNRDKVMFLINSIEDKKERFAVLMFINDIYKKELEIMVDDVLKDYKIGPYEEDLQKEEK